MSLWLGKTLFKNPFGLCKTVSELNENEIPVQVQPQQLFYISIYFAFNFECHDSKFCWQEFDFICPRACWLKQKRGVDVDIIQNDLRAKEKKALITFISFDLFWIHLSSSTAAFQKLVSNFQFKRGIPFFLISLLGNLKFGSTQNYPSNTFSKKLSTVPHFSLWNVCSK